MPKTTDTAATPDGTCAVRLFTPDGPGRWPGVVMFPDAGGVRDTFDRMAAKLAGFGYVVLLPDVYYREGDWAPFDMKTAFGDPQERARIMFMIGTLTPDRVTRDADALLNYLASRPEVIGDRFGVCGYCMGGRMSVVVAGRLPDRVAAAAAFHPGGLVANSPDSPHLLADRISASTSAARRTTRRSPPTTPRNSTKRSARPACRTASSATRPPTGSRSRTIRLMTPQPTNAIGQQ